MLREVQNMVLEDLGFRADIYTGTVSSQGLPHGKGRIDMRLERPTPWEYFYEGEFDHGKRHGQGAWYRSDGTVFLGRWRNDAFAEGRILGYKFSLLPELNAKELRVIADGRFVNDTLEGHGKITHGNGASFEGEFVEGLVQTNKNREPYYIAGLLSGTVIMRWPHDDFTVSSQWHNNRIKTFNEKGRVFTRPLRTRWSVHGSLQKHEMEDYIYGIYVGSTDRGRRIRDGTMYYIDGGTLKGTWAYEPRSEVLRNGGFVTRLLPRFFQNFDSAVNVEFRFRDGSVYKGRLVKNQSTFFSEDSFESLDMIPHGRGEFSPINPEEKRDGPYRAGGAKVYENLKRYDGSWVEGSPSFTPR